MDESFDPDAVAAALVRVEGIDAIARLSPDTQAVLLARPSDALLAALVVRVPGLRHLLTDGNGRHLTDSGLEHLRQLPQLETLDLEWSAVTDAGLPIIATLRSLRWLDIGGAVGVTPTGIFALRAMRPELEIETHEG